MKRYNVFACLLVMTMAVTAFATSDEDISNLNVADGSQVNVHYGSPISHSKADTVYVYGGPGTLEGKFENTSAQPDWGGWVTLDNTQKTESKWNISTYNAANIGGGGGSNHAWWCGEMWDSCGPGDDPEGYGNSYLERLDWQGAVASGVVSVSVTVTFEMEYDSEPGYDGTTLQYHDENGMHDVFYWDGADTVGQDPAYSFTFTVEASGFVGVSSDEVLLRFEFTADGGWSDEDCLWPTTGAAQIDDISVYFEAELQGTVEDCEGKAAAQWYTTLPPGVGDFAKVWPTLDNLDPCRSNGTPLVAFIDDGVVVPGTGGTMCTSWCYGPSGYTINPEGGLAGPDFHLDNYIISPEVLWNAPGADGVGLAYDVYSHADLSFAGYDGSFYVWAVRSSIDDGVSWSGWNDDNFVYYGGPYWIRRNFDCSNHLQAGKTHVQIRLGVYELGYVWGFAGTDASPAPYFDNIQLRAYEYGGPAFTIREIDMLQDNFPAIGTIDYTTLANNSIRVDMARNISLAAHLRNDPGDTMVVEVVPVRSGAVIDQKPRMYFKFKENLVFDTLRAVEWSADGYVEGDSVRLSTGAIIAEKWAFELPDEGWFFPGDVIHYYIRAEDLIVPADIGVSLLPADTVGFSDFTNPMSYNSSFTLHGLPSIYDHEGDLVTPKTLFWNDFANRGAEREWYGSFDNLGFVLGVDYDIYYTNGPSSGVGNGLGGRATADQIDGYSTMLYSAGNLSSFTISNLDYDNDPGDDVGLIDEWLRNGKKAMAIFGDDVVYDMVNTAAGQAFVTDWMGVSLTDRDLNPLIGNQTTPTVEVNTGNGVFNSTTDWVAYGGCLGFNTFDAVEVGIGTRLAHFLDTSGGDTYAFSAATLYFDLTDSSSVMSFPYGFHYIYTPGKAPIPSAARTHMLEEIMIEFNSLPGTPVVTDAPEVFTKSASAYPNPFNPQTKISWSLPMDCKVTVQMYNIRGNLVKTLVNDSVMPAEGHVMWNGDNNSGAKVASGVYFAKVRAPEFTKTIKIALVK